MRSTDTNDTNDTNNSTLKIRDRRDRAATETVLIDVARKVFSEKGYENTPTREVAALAGCSEVLIQRYFGGKDGLLLAVLKNSLANDQSAALVDFPFCPSVEEEAKLAFELTLKGVNERAAITKILLSRAFIDPDFNEEFKKVITGTDQSAFFATRLWHYQQKGEIDSSINLTSAAEMLLASLFQLCFFRVQLSNADEKDIRITAHHFCAIFARGLAPTSTHNNRDS
jgi:TetR/AcrR family transcriptional regulator, regulator of cefoperazone and chloramphenicol sensitivity